jgi:hypothetical protein
MLSQMQQIFRSCFQGFRQGHTRLIPLEAASSSFAIARRAYPALSESPTDRTYRSRYLKLWEIAPGHRQPKMIPKHLNFAGLN